MSPTRRDLLRLRLLPAAPEGPPPAEAGRALAQAPDARLPTPACSAEAGFAEAPPPWLRPGGVPSGPEAA